MGLETMFLISAAMQTIGGIAGYMEQRKGEKEAVRIAQQQAAIDKADAERAATQERIDAEKFRARQKMMFLKSGVDLSGSPLLLMEETRRKGEENARNIMESQAARSKLEIQQAKIKRSSLLKTTTDIGTGVMDSYGQFQQRKQLS